MFDFAHFTMGNMTECGMALRAIGESASTMEDAANQIVDYLYNNLMNPHTGSNAMALVRLYKTHDYIDLKPKTQSFCDSILPREQVPAGMKCLTLLATAGDIADWNSKNLSVGHQAIPLPSEQFVLKFPMVSNLVKQFGLELHSVINPDPSCLQDMSEITYNVFLVPEAKGSPYVPHQDDFVIPFGIKSVLGFGGILPSGNLYAIIMFSKISIQKKVAVLFKPLTLNIKLTLLPFDQQKVFDNE